MPDDSSPFYIWEAYSPYVMVRTRQLEGTYPHDQGLWGVTAMRVQCGWGNVDVSVWKDENHLNPTEPPGIDELAKQDRFTSYRRIRNVKDCVQLLDQKIPVKAGFEITNQWYNAKNGLIEDIGDNVTPHDSHAVTIWDHDPNHLGRGGFLFENTWGREWGNSGWGILTYDYFEKRMIDCWAPLKDDEVSLKGQTGIHLQSYIVPRFDKTYMNHMITDADRNERLGWCFCVPRGGFFDVEELYVKPEHRRKGIGNTLIEEVKRTAQDKQWPIRVWVSYADSYKENHQNLIWTASKLGLRLSKTSTPWAGYVGIPGETQVRLPSVRIPARPKAIREEDTQEDIQPVESDEEESKMRARRVHRGRLGLIEEGKD